MILKATPDTGDLVHLTEAEAAVYRRQTEYFSLGDILRLMRLAGDLNQDLNRSGLDPRLLLDLAAVRMAELESTVRLEDVLAMASEVGLSPLSGRPTTDKEPSLFAGPPQKKNDSFAEPRSLTPPAPEATVAYRPINLAQIKAGWENYLLSLKNHSQMLASQMRMAELRDLKDNQITVTFLRSGEISRQLVQKPDNMGVILQALRDHFKSNLTIRFDIDADRDYAHAEADTKNITSVDAHKLVESSPRLKKLMELVDGQIIGVRKNNTDHNQSQSKELADG
jgi:hypothetical protein